MLLNQARPASNAKGPIAPKVIASKAIASKEIASKAIASNASFARKAGNISQSYGTPAIGGKLPAGTTCLVSATRMDGGSADVVIGERSYLGMTSGGKTAERGAGKKAEGADEGVFDLQRQGMGNTVD